jgi:hypothetical protein
MSHTFAIWNSETSQRAPSEAGKDETYTYDENGARASMYESFSKRTYDSSGCGP